jgi:ribonuclease Z
MRFEVTILGTSGALPAYGRHCSGVFLRTEHEDVLIDCGEGTQMQLRAAGLNLGRTSTILITHLHGDHYFGLPGLLTSLALYDRQAPLTIVSPPHLRPRLAPLLELDRFNMPFPLEFRECTATDLEPLLSLKSLDIFAFPLRHRIETNGYLIREKERPPNIIKEKIEAYSIPWPSIKAIKEGGDFVLVNGQRIPHEELTTPAAPARSLAYCSDTLYFPELASYVHGADLLYHEATFLQDLEEDAHAKGHATAREAAMTAKAAGVGKLIMGHFSSRYPDVSAHEEEAREIFPNSFAAKDLWTFSVPYVGRGRD